MSRIISTIPQKPRSNRFKYYNTSTSSGGFNMSSGSSISPPQDDNQEVAYIDTFNNIPNPPEDGLKLVITQDTHEIFSWDYDANQWVNTTPESDVTQIIQGNYITIDPLTGKKAVTINSTPPTLTRQTDTTNNLDLLTDQTAMSGNTIQTRYKTLTQGTNMSITQTSNQIVLNSTGGGGISLSTSGTGNSVSSLSLSGSTLTQTMGYKLNSVTESPDSTQGVYFVSASAAPSYNNGVLNLPYKSLQQGNNINFTYNGSQVSINATGGGSSTANVQDVSSGIGTSILKMYRYTYTVSQQITLSGYNNYSNYIGTIPFTPLNIISNMTIPGNIIQQLPVSTYVLSQGQTGNILIIQNCNSQSITIPQNTYFSVLFFGI